MSYGHASHRRFSAAEELGYLMLLAELVVLALVLAYATTPAAPLVAAAAAGALALAVIRPLAALHVAVAAIPLELLSLSLGAAALTPAEAMFALTGIGWAIRRLTTGGQLFARSPLNAAIALGLVSLVAGISVADDRLATAKIAVMWTTFVLIFMMLNVEATPRVVRSLMLTLVVSATVVAVVAIVRLGGQEPELIGVGALAMGRASGSFGHPNALASFFVLALPAALVFAFVPTAALRPLIVAGFAAIFAALLFSLSRSGIVASAVALLVLLAWRPVRRAAGLLALAMLILTLAGSNPLAGSETTELVTKRLESISHAEGDDRLVLWRETPQIIQDHPVIGVGAGNFPSASARYGIVPSVGSPDEFAHAHSIPLTITAERGLLGLAALLWGGIALAMLVIRACRRREGFDRGIAFALASGLTGFAIQGALDYALGANVIVALLFVLAGSASVLAESH